MASPRARPLVIGHRGASGYRPEHTLAAYALAARLGADAIEPDLVSTADGVLVARHERRIDETTDVADRPELAGRRTTKEVGGVALSGWFVEDLTLAEVRTLRAKERVPELRPRNVAYEGEPIPTLVEVLALAGRLSAELGRPIGVAPETKHPASFRALGLGLEEPLRAALRDAPVAGPLLLQSFERESLERLRDVPGATLVQLLTAPEELSEIARYADAVGPAKALLLPRAADDTSASPTTFVADAHAAGLGVFAWTFRAENTFLPRELRSSAAPSGIAPPADGELIDPAAHGDLAAELRQAFNLGVDGVFCDHPDVAAAVRDAL